LKIGKVLGGYQPGFELVQGTEPGAIEEFTMICAGGEPRVLLPTARPMMQSAMSSFLGGRRLAAFISPCVQIASRAGGPFSRMSSRVSLMSQSGKPSPLRQLISDVIGSNEFQIALRVSFGRPNAKTVAMAISPSGEALCYVKLGSDAMTNDLVAYESAIIEQFEGTDMPVVMPSRLFSGIWANDQNVLITGPLNLKPLKRDSSVAHSAAGALAMTASVTNSALADSAYWKRIIKFAEEYEDSEVLLSAAAEIERFWGTSTFDFGVSHGDWTRANLGMVNGRLAALDWERSTKLSPRGIDIAHFAICEKTAQPFTKSINIDRVLEKVRKYLKSADLLPDNAEALMLFALLEMVIRFKSAENVGLNLTDLKFGTALKEGVSKWAL